MRRTQARRRSSGDISVCSWGAGESTNPDFTPGYDATSTAAALYRRLFAYLVPDSLRIRAALNADLITTTIVVSFQYLDAWFASSRHRQAAQP